MNARPHRLIRKGLLLVIVLGLLALVGPLAPPQPAMACYGPLMCPWGMHWDCEGCVCDCPINPWGDPYDWSNCGPCV